MEPTECPEMFETNYQSKQQNIPEQRRHQPEAISLQECNMAVQYRRFSSNIYRWIYLRHQPNWPLHYLWCGGGYLPYNLRVKILVQFFFTGSCS